MDDLARLQLELEQLEAEVAQLRRRKGGAVRRRFAVIVVLTGVLSVGVAALVSSQLSSGAETLYGTVSRVDGSAPVLAGTPCTAFYWPSGSDDYDGKLGVLCGQRTVYGGGSLGWLDCEDRDGRPWRCIDDDTTAVGGDPRLVLDRGAATITIEDAQPDWSVVIDLTLAGP